MKAVVRRFTLMCAALMLVASFSAPTLTALAAGQELITNGDFSGGATGWWSTGNITIDTSGGDLIAPVPSGTSNPWDAIVGQDNVPVTNGTEYRLQFDATSDADVTVHAIVQNGTTFHSYIDQSVDLTSTPTTFTYTFTADEDNAAAKFMFQMGGQGGFNAHFDNISLLPAELIVNGDFSDGNTGWWSTGNITIDTSGGDLLAPVPSGTSNPWDAIVGQDDVAVYNGNDYQLSFDASSDTNVSILAMVQNGTTFHNYLSETVDLTSTPTTFSYNFTADENNPAAKFMFQMGGQGAFNVHFDNISLQLLSEPPAPEPVPVGELLDNGTFSSGVLDPWWVTPSISPRIRFGRLEAKVKNSGTNSWDTIVGQDGIAVMEDGEYTLTLKAWASKNITVNAILQENSGAFTQYYSTPLALSTTPQTFTLNFTLHNTDPNAVLQFQMGNQGKNFTVFFDNLALTGPQAVQNMGSGELLKNGDYSGGFTGWWKTDNVSVNTSGGQLDAAIPAVVNSYDAIIGQKNVNILQDGEYHVSFVGSASTNVDIKVIVQLDGPPYTAYLNQTVSLTTTPQTFTADFTGPVDDDAADFQFQVGSSAAGAYDFHVDNVSLTGPVPIPPTEFLTIVRLNQTGYLPLASKQATVATEVKSTLPWTLYNNADVVVATGKTKLFGTNTASGEYVHIADFSKFKTPGTGYTLEVYGERSYPFDISNNVYSVLKYDALAYFYHNRSGIAITEPYSGGLEWTRPAGHINVAPNLGDDDVECFQGVDLASITYTGCSYTLDVTGGWYDAGDHGKYVVNGGISLWTMLNQYEHALHISGDTSAFDDGTMNIPENSNGVPDILDEARWEMEFLLSMQVPSGGLWEGQDMSGMVHHKMHDVAWTGLGLPPDQDAQTRYLYPPSTAATLNLAATAAQCARIWETIDPTFSAQCLAAAQTAWDAALAHPAMYAANNFTGGGPYDDTDVSDEFYWAASELFITTGDTEFRTFISASPYYLKIPVTKDQGKVVGSSFDWQETQALGTISIAVVPNNLSNSHQHKAQKNIVSAGSAYADTIKTEGYGLPYRAGDGGYRWGSNSDVVNNMMIIGLAYDFKPSVKFLTAISQGMDYLLGRNPNVKSYVSGYGERPLENPHHRFWAHSLNDDLPLPAPGAMSGGPNAALQDPFISTVFPAGCPSQLCYADHIQSYSTNEITINWNAPFAWVVAFLDEAHTLQVP
jgi:endoglucanase